jgi:hypothetical protein
MNPTAIKIAVARLENNRATAPYSRSTPPRPVAPGHTPAISGWKLPPAPESRRTEILGADGLSAASQARLARLKTLALGSRKELTPAAPASEAETVKKIPMSFNPPRWETKTLKAGPRKGQTVTQEKKWLLCLITRTVFCGEHAIASATGRLCGEKFTKPGSAGGKSFATLHQDFRLRWGAAEADRLTSFIAFRDE